MTTLLGFEIADDVDTVKLRQESPYGYSKRDVPALLEFGILIRDAKTKQVVMNPQLDFTVNDIRDFLNWIVGKRNPPLPPLVRKFLCLKRARIKNSIASVGTSPALRTRETQQIAEIDTMLRGDGATNVEDYNQCLTGGAGKFDSKVAAQSATANAKSLTGPTGAKGETGPTGPTGPKGNYVPISTAKGPVGVEPSTNNHAHCITNVNCDNSEVMKELAKIEEMINSLPKTVPAAGETGETGKTGEPGDNSDTASIHSLQQDIQSLRVLIEAQQKTSPVVQKADDAKKNATTGNLDELIANILEIRNYIRDHPCPPVPAAAALGKLNEIPAKNLPEATRKILSQVISILTKHSSATTETLKEIRTQLDSLECFVSIEIT